MNINKINMNININNVIFKNPIFNASGALDTTIEELNILNSSSSGADVSKSSSVKPIKGNSKPRYAKEEKNTINSMGTPNLGYLEYKDWYIYLRKNHKPFIHSLVGTPDEICQMIDNISMVIVWGSPYLIEVNLACPNITNQKVIAYDFKLFEEYLEKIQQLRTNLTIGLKLPPYRPHEFDAVSELILKYNKIKFITCINSQKGIIINSNTDKSLINPNNGYGGIGGPSNLYIGQYNVSEFYKRLGKKVDIIGCGGINSGRDVYNYILCGATTVAVGSAFMIEGKSIFDRLLKELKDELGDKCINDIRGKYSEADEKDEGY